MTTDATPAAPLTLCCAPDMCPICTDNGGHAAALPAIGARVDVWFTSPTTMPATGHLVAVTADTVVVVLEARWTDGDGLWLGEDDELVADLANVREVREL